MKVDNAPMARTFNELADIWVEHRALNSRTKELYERTITQYLKPAFGSSPLSEVTAQRIDQWRRAINVSPRMEQYLCALLKTMLRFGTGDIRIPGTEN